MAITIIRCKMQL